MGRRCRRHHCWSRCASWAVCDTKTQRLWVIAFVCAKPDGLMSVGPLCWTGQNEIFETKCCEMLSGNASLMSWFLFSLEGGEAVLQAGQPVALPVGCFWPCLSSAPSWLLQFIYISIYTCIYIDIYISHQAQVKKFCITLSIFDAGICVGKSSVSWSVTVGIISLR